jgi:hypothetical protein
VYQNGVKLVNGDDYTASDGATVTLATGAASGDSIVIVASFPRGLSDGYLKSEADARYSLVTDSTATANGVVYRNGSKALTTGSTLVFDGTKFGVGVTPASGWQAGRSVLQLSTAALDTYGAGQLVVRANNFWNGTNDKYISDGYATAYEHSGGTHRWYTAASGTAGNNVSFTQIAMFDTNGNWLVGTTTTDSGAKARFVFGASQNGLQIKDSNDTSNAAFLIFQNGSNSNFATIQRDGTNNSLSIGTVSAITFPATQVASAGANTLDDYEEGDWTPRISGSGGGNYTPGSINAGRYIKIGKMVWATATLQWTAVVSAYSGNLLVSGLPFTSAGQRAVGSMGAILNGVSFTAGYGEWNYLIDPGVAYVYIIQNSTTGAGYSHNPTVGSSGTIYSLSLVYEAA